MILKFSEDYQLSELSEEFLLAKGKIFGTISETTKFGTTNLMSDLEGYSRQQTIPFVCTGLSFVKM